MKKKFYRVYQSPNNVYTEQQNISEEEINNIISHAKGLVDRLGLGLQFFKVFTILTVWGSILFFVYSAVKQIYSWTFDYEYCFSEMYIIFLIPVIAILYVAIMQYRENKNLKRDAENGVNVLTLYYIIRSLYKNTKAANLGILSGAAVMGILWITVFCNSLLPNIVFVPLIIWLFFYTYPTEKYLQSLQHIFERSVNMYKDSATNSD